MKKISRKSFETITHIGLNHIDQYRKVKKNFDFRTKQALKVSQEISCHRPAGSR